MNWGFDSLFLKTFRKEFIYDTDAPIVHFIELFIYMIDISTNNWNIAKEICSLLNDTIIKSQAEFADSLTFLFANMTELNFA